MLSSGYLQTGQGYGIFLRPLFFLLLQVQGNRLGIKICDDLSREKQSADAALAGGSTQQQGNDEWPPERVTHELHDGPAPWKAKELIPDAWEPIHHLNEIMRLQAVSEIITNQPATALDLFADQPTSMRKAVFQHCVVLEYLLAEEGGVCGKLNDSSCCLQADDSGNVVKQITKEITSAHGPVQMLKGW